MNDLFRRDGMKTKFQNTCETGRSMIEMLGVLAIVGVLSVGGITGYSKAMAKFKITKLRDDALTMVSNIRTIWATEPLYTGLSAAFLVNNGAVPKEMVAGTNIVHGFGGNVTFNVSTTAGVKSFYIRFDGLPSGPCTEIASADWGADEASGFLGVGGGDTGTNTQIYGWNAGNAIFDGVTPDDVLANFNPGVAYNMCDVDGEANDIDLYFR